jgi:hypothetical protein
MPGVPVYVAITEAEHSVSSSRLSPYLYTISISHGPFTWTVRKRYHHFFKLNTNLFVIRNKPSFSQNKRPTSDKVRQQYYILKTKIVVLFQSRFCSEGIFHLADQICAFEFLILLIFQHELVM